MIVTTTDTIPNKEITEISGIARVYSYYVKFPKNRWDEIKIAEKSDKEGDTMFKKLGEEFDRTYYNSSNQISVDLHS